MLLSGALTRCADRAHGARGVGLTTDASGHTCLMSPSADSQRVMRAQAAIRDARNPYAVPSRCDRSDGPKAIALIRAVTVATCVTAQMPASQASIICLHAASWCSTDLYM